MRSTSGSSCPSWLASDPAGELEPVHLGHQHVESGHVERARRSRSARAPPRGARRRRAPFPTTASAGSRSRGWWRCRRRRGSAWRRAWAGRPSRSIFAGTSASGAVRSMWNVDPFALLALRPHRSVHQLDDALGDREAEPGAAVAARGRRVDLAERLEQPVHPILRDADAGVADGEVEAVHSAPGGLGVDVDDHLAPLRELHRVREQVEEHLPEPSAVAHDSRRHARRRRDSRARRRFSEARGATMSSAPSTHSRRSNGSRSSSSLPASIFEKSRMSSITRRSASPLDRTTSANSRCSGVSSVPSSRPVIPITAFIGVRISWLIVARKALFARVAASASSRARSQLGRGSAPCRSPSRRTRRMPRPSSRAPACRSRARSCRTSASRSAGRRPASGTAIQLLMHPFAEGILELARTVQRRPGR